MTIDEAIIHAREKADKNSSCWKYCTDIKHCKTCEKEHEQLAEWLEELKVYQQHEIICNKGYNSGYNKALDDFVNSCKSNKLFQTFGLRLCDIEEIAEQLKERR